jgi:hypothetical protein
MNSGGFRRLLLISMCAGVAMITTAGFAQNPYTVCIGDRCDYPAYVNLNCSFAAAHPNDADDEVAKLVCRVRNNYEKYTYVRTSVIKGGRCGATYVQVRCH